MLSDGSFRAGLREALELWQREGLITPAQARRILAYHGLPPGEAEETRRNARLVSTLAILGAVLVGIGIILFVAANWQRLDRLQRIALLLATLVAVYGLGYRFRYEPGNYRRIGEALIFLGTLVLGANIFLIAQIYHVPSGEPSLLALWSLGAATTAYATLSSPALVLAVVAAVGWYVLQLAAWEIDQLGAAGVVALAAFIPYGLLILSLGELHRSLPATRPLSTAFTSLGLAVALAPVWLFAFADFWESLILRATGGQAGGTAVAQVNTSFAVFAALALLLALGAMWRFRFSRSSIVQGVGVLILGASSLVVVIHPFQDPRAYAGVFNALLLAAVLWSVVVGLWTRRESFINLGIVFFVLLVAARYFDFFFSFMDRSLVFIGAGALLMIGGYLLERSRRRLLVAMRQAEEAPHA